MKRFFLTLALVFALVLLGSVYLIPPPAAYAAVELDTNDDYADCGSAASLDSLALKTIFVRAKFSDVTQFNPLAFKNADGSGPQFWFENGVIAYRDSSWSVASGQWEAAVSLSNDTYYNIAVKYDSGSTSNDAVIYLNGVAQTTTREDAPSGTYNGDAANIFQIGKTGDDLSLATIDWVWVTNTLVSDGNMATIQTNGYDSAVSLLGSAVKGNWGMNDGADGTSADGDTIADSSGNSNNCTGVDGADNAGLIWRISHTLEQEGFRFRDDDGNETAASWLATQDTDLNPRPLNTNTRLRVLVDSAGDVAPKTLQLEWKKSDWADSTYRKVGETQELKTIAIRSENSGTATSDSGDGTFTVTAPGTIVDGDVLVILLGKSIYSSTTVTCSGFTLGHQLGSTTGNDVYGGMFYKVASSESGNYTCDSAGTSEPFVWSIFSLSGVNNATPADVAFNGTGAWFNSQNDTSPNLPTVTTVTAGAFALGVWVLNTDTATTQPGGSWANEIDDLANTAVMNVVSQTFPTAATATGTSALGSVAANQEAETATFVFRPASETVRIVLALSSNFTDGDNTTNQLTAPASGSFSAGEMSESSNPVASINLADNEYTEIEFNFKVQSPAINTDVYNFRATAAGTALNTYSVSPDITIGDVGGDTYSGRGIGRSIGRGIGR